jgi:hypothetical protein
MDEWIGPARGLDEVAVSSYASSAIPPIAAASTFGMNCWSRSKLRGKGRIP